MGNKEREIKLIRGIDLSLDGARELMSGIHSGSGGINLTWGGYDYLIDACTIDTPEKVLGWVVQLADKTWMDAAKLRAFVQVAAPFCGKKGWCL